ncbi:MAG: MFS transporter, partial [Actinobacteria bacterium]|nr:MFS transporter [Actinomycetota bacterium]
NNTFRQVGIATGIAGLGAIFQASYMVGGTKHQFVHGLNNIFLVATFVALAGTILGFALVRGRDFVASAPEAAAAH